MASHVSRRRTPDTRRCGRQRIQAVNGDVSTTTRTHAVRRRIETSDRCVDFGEFGPGFGEQGSDLLTFPGDRVALGIVFVVGGAGPSRLHDALEGAREARNASVCLGTQFGETDARIPRIAS